MSEFKRAVEWDAICGNHPTEQSLDDLYTKLSISLVTEEYRDELIPAIDENDMVEVVDAIGDLFKVLSQLSYSLTIDPEKVFKEVNDSNYSKFCYKESDAVASVERYAHDNRYHGVYYEKIDDLYVIFGYKEGEDPETTKAKVLKGIHYQSPDIQQFIR